MLFKTGCSGPVFLFWPNGALSPLNMRVALLLYVYLLSKSAFMRIQSICVIALATLVSGHGLLAQQGAVELYANDTFGMVGQEVAVHIKANGFTDIISAQASINWNPTLIQFTEVNGFGIPGLSAEDFGLTQAAQGHVRFLWIPADAQPVSLEEGAILFTAVFNVSSADQSPAELSFIDVVSDVPYVVEFVNSEGLALDVQTSPGLIELANPEDAVRINSTPNTSCDPRVDNGSLQADIFGDTINYTFNWFVGASTDGIPVFTGALYEQLPGGDYALEVLNQDGDIIVSNKTAFVEVAPVGIPETITEVANLPQVSCSEDAGDHTGTVEIAVNGSQTSDLYTISWWKDAANTGEELVSMANSYIANGLTSGDYEVVVENPSTTCKSYFSTSVNEELVSFTISLSSTDDNYCQGGANGSASATANEADELSLRYFWFLEDAAIDTTQALSKNATLENAAANSYKAYVLDSHSKCTAQGVVDINSSPIIPNAEITQSNDTLFASHVDAEWFRNDTPLNVTGAFYVPTAAGSYTINVINEYGCSAASDEFSFEITGIPAIEQGVSVFPNPFSKYLNITKPDGMLDELVVFDIKGNILVQFFHIKQNFIQLDLSGSYQGVYLIKMQQNGKIITRKATKSSKK
jgi:hypothetical protein